MISAYLDSIKKDAARIYVEYTNGLLQAEMLGDANWKQIFDDSKRAGYLFDVIDQAYLSGATVYVGDTAVTDAYIQGTRDKIQHYSGVFDYVDLSESSYDAITPDDGEGGSIDIGGTTTDSDHYRSDTLAVSAGVNVITFLKNGVPSPLASAEYTLQVWVQLASGYVQHSLVISDKVAGGFVVNDVTAAGTLSYTATLDT